LFAELEVDAREFERRRGVGLGAVTDRQVLQGLLSLPPDTALPVSLLSSSARRALARMPAGVVEVRAAQVARLLRPALSLRSVGVMATSWAAGFGVVAEFASHCTRYVVVPGRPRGRRRDLDEVAVEARYYGVGLAVFDDDLEWLVGPREFVPERFTAGAWLTTERMLEALADSNATALG